MAPQTENGNENGNETTKEKREKREEAREIKREENSSLSRARARARKRSAADPGMDAVRTALGNLVAAVSAVADALDAMAKGDRPVAFDANGVRRALCDAKDALAPESAPEAWKRAAAAARVKRPPTLEELLDHAHRIGFCDDAYTREWHRLMSEEYLWHDKKGKPIGNWRQYFHQWRANRAVLDKVRDPGRIPDARNCTRGQLSNHLETSKEVRDDLLSKCGF